MKSSLLTLLFLVFSLSAWADEQTIACRVTGLFTQSRAEDFRTVIGYIPSAKVAEIDFDFAEAKITLDPAVAFPKAKPEKLLENLDQAVRVGSNSTMGILPISATPHAQLTRIEIPVVGLDCLACSLATYEAIFKIDGVVQATASYKEGRVTALIDPAKTERAALESALEKKKVMLGAKK